jgi:2'-5' RNA ligase
MMNDEWVAGYQRLWQMRSQAPIVTESWANSEWARGRTDYITFLIKVEAPEIITAAQKAQEGLRAFSCADPYPAEYLHLTVKETGCFLVDEKESEDEITREEITKLVESAREALGSQEGFTVNVQNLNHFRSNIVAEAHDGGEIREMNRRLMGLEGVQKMGYDYPSFLPHMSMCQFKETDDHDQLVEYLEKNRETALGGLKVDRLSLVKAVLPVEERYPVLEVLDTITLV